MKPKDVKIDKFDRRILIKTGEFKGKILKPGRISDLGNGIFIFFIGNTHHLTLTRNDFEEINMDYKEAKDGMTFVHALDSKGAGLVYFNLDNYRVFKLVGVVEGKLGLLQSDSFKDYPNYNDGYFVNPINSGMTSNELVKDFYIWLRKKYFKNDEPQSEWQHLIDNMNIFEVN